MVPAAKRDCNLVFILYSTLCVCVFIIMTGIRQHCVIDKHAQVRGKVSITAREKGLPYGTEVGTEQRNVAMFYSYNFKCSKSIYEKQSLLILLYVQTTLVAKKKILKKQPFVRKFPKIHQAVGN